MPDRRLLLLVSAPVLALCLAACGSSSPSTSPSTPPAAAGTTAGASAGGGSSAAPVTSSDPATSASPAASGGATFSGDYAGTIAANLCTGSGMSIKLKVTGDDTTYLGVLSATSAGFVGPEAADFSIPDGGSEPTVSGTTYTVDGVVLEDIVVSHKKVTLHGSLTCP